MTRGFTMSSVPEPFARRAYASGADTEGSGSLKARPNGPPNSAIMEENLPTLLWMFGPRSPPRTFLAILQRQ